MFYLQEDLIGAGTREASFSIMHGKRLKLVKILQKRYGKRFGLFGAGWNGQPSWQGEVPYAAQLDICKRSQVIFGGAPGIHQDYYASDRPVIQGCSGTPFVDWHVPRINRFLRENDHWYLAHDEKSMIRQIDGLLAQDPTDRLARAHRTASYVHEKFSQLGMMRFLVTTLQQGRSSQISGKTARIPKIPFFLPEVNLDDEEQFATRNWATK